MWCDQCLNMLLFMSCYCFIPSSGNALLSCCVHVRQKWDLFPLLKIWFEDRTVLSRVGSFHVGMLVHSNMEVLDATFWKWLGTLFGILICTINMMPYHVSCCLHNCVMLIWRNSGNLPSELLAPWCVCIWYWMNWAEVHVPNLYMKTAHFHKICGCVQAKTCHFYACYLMSTSTNVFVSVYKCAPISNFTV